MRTEEFTVPLLARPADLVDIDDANRPDGMDDYLAFARDTPQGPVEYFDRGQIERGALAGKGLEIAWLAEKVDAFFIHVQGAARLKMTDGRLCRVTYAAKSGQRFTGPGKILADLGEIPLEKVTMQSIRAWFRAHPDRVDEILWQNRSYIFFREADVDDAALGSDRRRQGAADAGPLARGRPAAAHIRHALLHKRTIADRIRGKTVPAADDCAGHRLGHHRTRARRSVRRFGRCRRRDRRRRA